MKLSGEATIGLLFEVLVGILDHLHVREPFIIWGLFAVGLVLIGDSIVRGEWGERITDPKKRTARRILYGAAAGLCFIGFGIWIFVRLHAEEPRAAVTPPPSIQPQQPLPKEPDQGSAPLVIPKAKSQRQAAAPKALPVGASPIQPQPAPAPVNIPIITQGSGSAFSINQQGGITAGTINYGAPDRRLTDDQKTSLENCLRTNPGKFSIVALSGKAYKYALDWSEVFSAAGWNNNENQIPVASGMIGAGDWSGLRFGISGSWDDAKKQALLKEGSPEMTAYQCISAPNNNIIGGGLFIPYSDMATGRVQISLGDY
ncbi:MAG: hypothetical protein WBP73_13280 [Terriglobales bacterium]